MAEYIGQNKLLGGLLFLLPPKFSPDNLDTAGGADVNSEIDLTRNTLNELEQLLIYANIRVSHLLKFFHKFYDGGLCICLFFQFSGVLNDNFLLYFLSPSF